MPSAVRSGQQKMVKREHRTLLQVSEANFSECDKYRYLLVRTWDESKPSICYLLLNPSTATEMDNDPTLERCQRRASTMGYGAFIIVNIFPYRLTDSKLLKTVPDLIGDKAIADEQIVIAVAKSAITICGWGAHKLAIPRAREIMAMLEQRGLTHKIHCLQQTKDGNPQHPLYISYAVQPKPWRQQ